MQRIMQISWHTAVNISQCCYQVTPRSRNAILNYEAQTFWREERTVASRIMPVHSPALPGCFLIKIIVLLICSLSILTVVCDESLEGKCVSLADGHFDFCTKGGYNSTLSFPKEFTAKRQAEVAGFLTFMIEEWRNCSTLSLVTAMECSFFVPKCSSKGTRVYPCRRVCGELLKQCQNYTSDYRELYMDLLLAWCLILPNETASSEKCFEPPGFTPNNNISSKFVESVCLFYPPK